MTKLREHPGCASGEQPPDLGGEVAKSIEARGQESMDPGTVQVCIVVYEDVAESGEIRELCLSLLADETCLSERRQDGAVGERPRQRESRDAVSSDVEDRLDSQLQEALSRPIVPRVGEVVGKIELGEAFQEAQVLVEDSQPCGYDLAFNGQAAPPRHEQ